jgi:hypothetical protein
MNPNALVANNGFANGSNGSSNGKTGKVTSTSQDWLQQTARQFFTGINWENRLPEIQPLQQVTHEVDQTDSLSLLLTVQQFFDAINWSGAVAAPSPVTALPADESTSTARDFTLDDFSSLF